MDLELTGTRALVTGGSAGIGLATAELLAREGARVAIVSRRPEEAAAEAGVAAIAADLATAGGPAQAVETAVSELGGLDLLVNNAGTAHIATFEELTDDDWDGAWSLNVMSYVRCIRAVLPGMKQAGAGTIVNVSSTAGKRPSTGMPNYSVTKAAVLSLSRLVADLYAKHGIRCNAVAPGPTATPAWLGDGGLADQQAAASIKTRQQVLEAVGAGRPLGRLAEPAEIASVIAFLCSERASYVTGSAWSADGGTVPIIV
jgi:NAD(P)-dependent dehydrogenase (short-subunit alcohol dehydrogenase family)